MARGRMSVLWSVGVTGMLAWGMPLVAGPPAAVAPPAAAANSLEASIQRVQSTYSKFQSLTARFVQEAGGSPLGKARRDTGQLELKKGGKMRWRFETPEKREFISDGTTLWIYAPAEKQVLESPLSAGASPVALNFLAGLGDIKKDFVVSAVTDAAFQKSGYDALHLTPRAELGGIKRLTLLFLPQDGIVRETWIEDQMGSRTHMTFSDVKFNAPVEDRVFSFQVPAGVQVLKP